MAYGTDNLGKRGSCIDYIVGIARSGTETEREMSTEGRLLDLKYHPVPLHSP